MHEVGPCEQLVELDLRRAPCGRLLVAQIGVVREHRHRERRAQLHDAAPDLAHTHDPERLAGKLGSAQLGADLHDLTPDHAIGERDLLREREHEAERVLRHRFAPRAGVVADDHPGGRARLDVDDVVARPGRTHREEVGTALEQIGAADPLLGDAGVAGELGADERLVAVGTLEPVPVRVDRPRDLEALDVEPAVRREDLPRDGVGPLVEVDEAGTHGQSSLGLACAALKRLARSSSTLS